MELAKKRILNFCDAPDYKGETIGKDLEACLLEWGIKKILTVTLHNASSNEVAIRYLKRRTKDWKGIVLKNEFMQLRCSAHILNLIVKEGLHEQNESICRVRNAVRYIRLSPNRLASFKSCVEKEKIDGESSLSLDCETRWNSTYLMLETAEKFQKAFDRMYEDDAKFRDYFRDDALGRPDDFDWENVRIFIKFLRLFYNITLKFSGSLYVTSNTFFHEFFSI